MSPMPADPPDISASHRPTPRRVIVVWLIVVLIVPIALAPVRISPDLDRRIAIAPTLYFALVALAALSGVAAALAISIAAVRTMDERILATSLGFLIGAAIVLIHSLFDAALPEAQPELPVVGLAMCSVFIVLGAFAPPHPSHERWRRRVRQYLALGALLLVAGVIGSFADRLAPAYIATVHVSAAVTGVACGVALWKYAQLYRQSALYRSLPLLAGIILLGEAALICPFAGSAFSVSFWLYHAVGVAGMALIGYASLYDVRRPDQRNLSQRAAFEQMRPLLSDTMNRLIELLERDASIPADARARIQRDTGLSDAQIDALERLALAAARERRQREELVQLDEQLRQSVRNTALLAQMVVHDLKNPLTALIGYLELLSASDLDESQQSLINNALRNGRDLAGLVEDLLDLIRYNEGRLRLRLSDVNLPVLCAECADELAGWLTYEAKTLILNVPPALPLIRADSRILRRILLNLLSNAIKHTPRGTTITLSVWREPHPDGGEQTVIEVADTGPGIPPDRIERLFEPFGVTGESRSARQSSTGLGLAFCKMAVAAHGGTIEVSSFPGDGATFRIRLPDR